VQKHPKKDKKEEDFLTSMQQQSGSWQLEESNLRLSKKNSAPQAGPNHYNRKKWLKETNELVAYEMNDLLNFQYNDTSQYANQPHVYHHKPKKMSEHQKSRLKINYIKGNFRFLVNPTFNCDIRYYPPDEEIDWECIEQVRYITNNKIVCPICLNDPDHMTVSLITKCGHLFCWPCIIRYLSYKKTRCPLCNEYLIENDFKLATISIIPPYKADDIISFDLKKRNKYEYSIMKAESFEVMEQFCRIKKINYAEVKELYEGEKKKLYDAFSKSQQAEDKELGPFIMQGIEYFDKKIKDAEAKLFDGMKGIKREEEIKQRDYSQCADEDFYYFYQESNGLNIYLHPLCHKVMRAQYGEGKNLPKTIDGMLIELESLQQNDLTRKKYRFLNNVPLNADISFAEIEMLHLLDPKLYGQFQDEVKEYRLKHQPPPNPKETSKSNGNAKLSKNHSTPVFTSNLPIVLPPDLSELKLDDHSAYPELPKAKEDYTYLR
jgi:hypothetical protein